ncbi:DNA N-6-adenine-methyltransferase [Enterobacter kobei]|uniref:TraR/DksA family transcriptional regulator n=1 Tax=Enterobacter kobei TaxID=208224 RepID=UPI003D6EB2E2
MTDYTGSNTPAEQRDLWRTPPALFASLDAEFCFQLDAAAEIEELQRNAALSAHRLNRNAVSAERCEECDEPIPEPRRAVVPGCQTCADCQGVIELRKKQRGA